MAQELTVGEVVTYFEGMADGLFKTLDEIEKRLKALTKKDYIINVGLSDNIVNDVEKGVTRVTKAIGRVEDITQDIGNNVHSLIKKLTQNIGRLASTAMERFGEQGESALGKWLYRIIGVTTALVGIRLMLGKMSFVTGMLNQVTTSLFNAGVMLKIINHVNKKSIALIVPFLSFKWSTMFSGVDGFVLSIKTLVPLLGAMAANTSTLITGFLTIIGPATLLPFFLYESLRFIKGITHGISTNLTLIEHVSRFVKTLDNSLETIYGTSKRIFTIVGGTIIGGIISQLFPIFKLPVLFTSLNAFFGMITRTYTVFKTNLLSSLGIGRKTFQVMMWEIIHSMGTVSGIILKIAKWVKKFSKASGGKQIVDTINTIVSQFDKITKSVMNISKLMKKLVPQEALAQEEKYTESVKKMEKASKRFLFFKKKIAEPVKMTTGTESFVERNKKVFSNILKDAEAEKIKVRIKDVENTFTSFFFVLSTVGQKMSNSMVLSFQSIINEMNRYAKGKTSIESFQKTYTKFISTLKQKSGEEKNVQGMITLLEKLKVAKFNTKDLEQFTTQFKKMQDLSKNKNITKFMWNIAKGVKEGGGKAAEQIKILSKTMSSFLTPGGSGMLKNAEKSGTTIGKQIAAGIIKATPIISKVMLLLTASIAAFLPSSPAKMGPLTALPRMGYKIVYYLAKSMLSAAPRLKNAMTKIISIAWKPLVEITKKAANFQFFAKVIGSSVATMSQLEYAAKTVGGSMQDLTINFRTLQGHLAKVYDMETKSKFESIKIDLENVAGSIDPVNNLFLKLIKVIHTAKAGSKSYTTALTLLGGMTQSVATKLAVLYGEKGVKRLMKESAALGTSFTKSFADMSRQFTETRRKIIEIKNSLKYDLLESVLPLIKKATAEVFDVIKNNRTLVKAYILTLSKAFIKTTIAFTTLVKSIVTNPKAAWEELKFLAKSMLVLASKTVKEVYNIVNITANSSIDRIFAEVRIQIIKQLDTVIKIFYSAIDSIWKRAKKVAATSFFKLGGQIKIEKTYIEKIVESNLQNANAEEKKILSKIIDSIKVKSGKEQGLFPTMEGKSLLGVSQEQRENKQIAIVNKIIASYKEYDKVTKRLKVKSSKLLQKITLEVSRGIKGSFMDLSPAQIALIRKKLDESEAKVKTKIAKSYAKIKEGAIAAFTLTPDKVKKAPIITDLFKTLDKIWSDVVAKGKKVEEKIKKAEKKAKKIPDDIEKPAKMKTLTLIEKGMIEINKYTKENTTELEKQLAVYRHQYTVINDTLNRLKKEDAPKKVQEATEALVRIRAKLLGDSRLSDTAKLTKAYQASQVALANARKKPGADVETINVLNEDIQTKYFTELHEGTLTALNTAFDSAFSTFIEEGTLSMENLAEIGKNLFVEQAKQAFEQVKKILMATLVSAFKAAGAGEAAQGLVAGVIGAAGFLLSKLKSASEQTYTAIKETAVESATAMRGVIAGVESIGIQEVGLKFVTGITPLIDVNTDIKWLVSDGVELLRSIDGKMGAGSLSAEF